MWEILSNLLELEMLYTGLCQNSSINALDLSRNKLDDKCGGMIGKIISEHGKKRDELVYIYSIRGHEPEEDIDLKGKKASEP
mgnify:FL=1